MKCTLLMKDILLYSASTYNRTLRIPSVYSQNITGCVYARPLLCIEGFIALGFKECSDIFLPFLHSENLTKMKIEDDMLSSLEQKVS